MTVSDNLSAIEKAAEAILAKVPTGYGMTRDEAVTYAEAALSAYPTLLAEARKAEAMKREIAELREVLGPFAAVAEHDIGDDETDEELFRPMNSHNRAPRLTVGSLRRARTLLNGGSDAQQG